MSVVLQIYAIIVTLSLIIVLSFYLFHRREVTRLSQKLQTLLHSFTHAELTLDFPSSDITDLVNALNELLRVYHKQVYSLQKKDEAIKETITNLAHDLRTPVTAIQGYTQQIYDIIWNEPYSGDYNVVMRHICNIREKIEDDPGHPVYIQTVRGVGYRFNGNLGSE